MDVQRIERRIKKINAVLEAFNEDNKISSIEKDLLLGYIRDLYDMVRESDTESFDLRIENKKEPLIKDVIVEKKVEVKMPVEVSKIEILAIEKPEIPAEIKIEKVVEEKAEVLKPKYATQISAELESIFIMEEITDLSDKLSMSKISDILAAMGINKRFELTKELFNGDTKHFNEIIKKLNLSSNFEEAKSILINEVALPLNWEKEDKLKEAQQLVKLVRRKFSV